MEDLPAISFGHGNPMNAILENAYTSGWHRIGEELPRPREILSISAHWFVPATGVDGGSISMLSVSVGSTNRDAHAHR